jgi:hypothetical protein
VPSRIRRHPVLAAILLGCTLGGVALGVHYLPEDWSLLRRGLAGAVAGAGTGLLITATRLYV